MPHTGSGAWGYGGWGYGSWGGGGGGGAIALLSVASIRENVFRLEFSVPVYWTGILDENDGSIPTKYAIAVVPGTVGLDGNPVRPLMVSEVYVPGVLDGVAAEDVGRFVDVISDRPMTPHPALYDVTCSDIFAADLLSSVVSSTLTAQAVFKRIEPPSIATAIPSRDFANPMTRDAMFDPLPNPNDPLNLGTIVVDDTGDYAFDEGLTNLRKRILRRLITRKGAFAHLPNYGVGVPDYGKRLAVAAVVADVAAQAEAQIGLEPDVARVKVRPILDPNTPGLVRFQVLVRPRTGAPQRFDVPFVT